MAKGAKVLKYASSESSENESDENLKPSYSKLAKIAAKLPKALKKVRNMLDKSDDMLGEELDHTKALIFSQGFSVIHFFTQHIITFV